MHILRVCKKNGYSLDYLHYLFHSLIISLFAYGISVWGTAAYDKYLSGIDKFQKRAVRFAFFKEVSPVACLLETQTGSYGKTSPAPPKARWLTSYHPVKLGHLGIEVIKTYKIILPQIRTERFKRCFIYRCLFNYI